MNRPITVGCTSKGYPEIRNIFSLPFKNTEVVRRYDLMNVLDHIYFRIFKKINPHYHWLHRDLGMNDVDLFHFFNKISYSNTPWVTTFESYLPYFTDPPAKYMRLVAGDPCRKLIAMSERAYNIEMDRLDKHPEYRGSIKGKTIILHPPQKKIIGEYGEKSLSTNEIVFSLVGRDFFRKGGLEVLNVFDRLLEKKLAIRLHIVSAMEYGDYVSRTSEKEYREALRIIEKNKLFIHHHSSLPNEKVIELFTNSHVSLLPSYHESYGYSVLEAQACGTPVITTDIAAMPEINSDRCGWLIQVPKNSLREGLWRTDKDKNIFSLALEQQLEFIITGIMNDPSVIREKGITSIERIEREHSPADKAAILEDIYKQSTK